MCLSGDVYDLSTHQWEIVEQGIDFYQKAAQIIRDGRTYRVGSRIESYNHPTGWQAVIRKAEQDYKVLVVIHTFDCMSGRLEIPLKCLSLSDNSDAFVSYTILEEFHREQIRIDVYKETLIMDPIEDFEGAGIILQQRFNTTQDNLELPQ